MTDEFLEKRYEETFDLTYETILRRKKEEEGFTIDKLESLLETEYLVADNGWAGGKSDIKEAQSNAVIAAYERALIEWREENQKKII